MVAIFFSKKVKSKKMYDSYVYIVVVDCVKYIRVWMSGKKLYVRIMNHIKNVTVFFNGRRPFWSLLTGRQQPVIVTIEK